MTDFRPILAIEQAAPVDMGGLVVKQPLPTRALDQHDPFLLLHHARWQLRGGSQPQHAGVPPHPHRGFAPVTFIYRGGVHHRDSLGNDSVIQAGGVQWVTAGRGIVHSERPPRDLAEEGGEQEIIQLWINLPARHKMAAPSYQSRQADALPTAAPAPGVAAHVVAGTFEGHDGPIETLSPLVAVNLVLDEGASYDVSLPPSFNAFAYLLDGGCRLNGATDVPGEHLAAVSPGAGPLRLEAHAPTRILLMAGEPLGEPVAASGPFVMNTSAEIYQAMRDYQAGKMGVLKEVF